LRLSISSSVRLMRLGRSLSLAAKPLLIKRGWEAGRLVLDILVSKYKLLSMTVLQAWHTWHSWGFGVGHTYLSLEPDSHS
jgi:hypothetical protein